MSEPIIKIENVNTKNVVLIAKFISPGIHENNGPNGNHPPKNNNAVINDIIIICEYSAKKNNANVIPEYSVLKPDTNSDSASAWSNGALFVSANADTKNIIAAGNNGKINQQSFCARTISVKFNEPTQTITFKIINPIHTS